MSSSLHQPSTRVSEATAGRRSEGGLSLAAQVCSACKARKKKCDKALPRCGFCALKGLRCDYDYDSSSSLSPGLHLQDVPAVGMHKLNLTLPLPPVVIREPEAALYNQVQTAIRTAGLFVDELSVRYFQGIHRHLPIISRARFHQDLTTLGSTPSADFSSLLLAICLISSCPALERPAHTSMHQISHVDHSSLYLTARSLFAQVQALISPSVYLVQARLLLALYEYVIGQPDRAFASIADCARMAYAARFHLGILPPPRSLGSVIGGAPIDRSSVLRDQEVINTWWGIVICERTFFCDVTVKEQPLVTIVPGGDALLPSERATTGHIGFSVVEPGSDVRVSSLGSVNVDSFGHSAQAAWLLDQVYKTFDISVVDTRLFQLQGLDTTLQSFLVALMQKAGWGNKACGAVTTTIRALFALHWHILDVCSSHNDETYQTLLDPQKSYSALDTATKMVLDVVEAVENDTSTTCCVAPGYSHLIRAALEHVYRKNEWEEDGRLQSVEERLQSSLERLRLNKVNGL